MMNLNDYALTMCEKIAARLRRSRSFNQISKEDYEILLEHTRQLFKEINDASTRQAEKKNSYSKSE